nr:ubiquitin hydrolase [Tanacetum cinerariifolium]
MSWTGLPKFADDTITDYTRPSPSVESNPNDLQNNSSSVFKIGESTGSILSKPEIKFLKPADSLTVAKTNKDETVKKPAVKYAELYRKTSKRSNVRGNQRNWNNMKSQQLGKNFLMKNKACYNYGCIDHLSYDCGRWVDQGRTRAKNKYTQKRRSPRAVFHKTDRPPMRTTRPNMNAAPRPNSLVRSFKQEKNNIQALQKKKMAKSSSSSKNEPCCSKACKKNTDSLNSKITDLSDKLDDNKNMLYHYKLGLSRVEARLELEVLKKEKKGLDSKLTGFKSATKDLDNLIGSRRSDKIKEGLGKGPAMPIDPHHAPIILQSSSSQPQKTHKPKNPTRKVTNVPQPSDPIEHVTDEAVYKELGDSLVRAATTTLSLETEQDSVIAFCISYEMVKVMMIVMVMIRMVICISREVVHRSPRRSPPQWLAIW